MVCTYCNGYIRKDAWKTPSIPEGFMHRTCAVEAHIDWKIMIREHSGNIEKLTRKKI